MYSLKSFVSIGHRILSQSLSRRMFSKNLVDLTIDVHGVGVLTIQHPPNNGMSIPVMREISKSLDEILKNKCTGMILTTSSPTILDGGLDIRELYKPDPKRLEEFYFTLQGLWIQLFGAEFPTTAAINGHLPGGGCLLGLTCEYRAMVGGPFVIGLNEVAAGIVLSPWAFLPMCNIIGQREAELAFTSGKMYTVSEAKKVGLIDEIATDKEDALAKCNEFIEKFALIPPLSRARTKQTLRRGPLEWMKKHRQADLHEFLENTQRPEVQKSIEIFIQSLDRKKLKTRSVRTQ